MAMKQTTKSLVTTLALLFAAAVVGAGALWVNKDEAKKAEQKEKSAQLFELDKAAVRSLRLEKAGAPAVELKRADAGAPWKIAAPAQAAGSDADEAAVPALIDKLASLRQKAEVEGMDAKAAGFEGATPRLKLTLGLAAGNELALLVGGENAFDASAYVRRNGETAIRTVASADVAALDKTLFELRDKRVAHVDAAAEVSKLEVAGPQAPYALTKIASGWQLARPERKADAAAAERAASALKNLRASGIAAESADAAKLKELGLAKALITATLTVGTPGAKDAVVRTVLIGQPAKAAGSVAVKTYAKRDDSPTVFEVDGQIVRDLDKPLFAFEDKSVVSFDREQVKRIELQAPGSGTLSIARRNEPPPDGGVAEETFEVLAPSRGPAKKWKISGALYSLSSLKAAAFGEPLPKDAKALARLGLDKPRTATIFGEADKVLARIAIGAEVAKGEGAGKRRYVHADGAPRVVEVETSVLDELPRSLADVLEPPPAPAPGPRSLPDGGTAGGLTNK